jgi:hypothetical protein
MEQPLSADQLQHILDTLKADHTNFMTIWRTHWRVDDRPAATDRLAASVTKAEQAAGSLSDTRAPELLPLVDKLIIESTMAADVLKHPSILER